MTTDAETQKVFEEFWQPLVMPDGITWDLEQVKKELYDYHQAIENVSLVYDHITMGRFSKINTDPIFIIGEADYIMDEFIREATKKDV